MCSPRHTYSDTYLKNVGHDVGDAVDIVGDVVLIVMTLPVPLLQHQILLKLMFALVFVCVELAVFMQSLPRYLAETCP